MDIVSPGKRKKLLRLALFAVAACMVIYACAGFLFFPLWGKGMVEKKLSALLHREVVIDAIYTNPFLFTVDIRNLVVEKGDKASDPFVSVDRVFVDLSPRMMFTPALFISRIEVIGPRISLTRNPDQSFNFSDLIADRPRKTNKQAKDLFPLVVSDIRLDKGQAVFTDHARSVVYQFGNIDFHFWDLSTLAVADEQGKENPSIAISGRADVKDISLDHKEFGSLVNIAQVSMILDHSDLLNLDISARQLELVSPEVHVLRDQEKHFPLVSVFAPSIRDTARTKEQENSLQEQADKAAAVHQSSSFSLNLQGFSIRDGRFHFLDKSRDFSASISPLQFHITNFIFRKYQKGDSVSGSFALDMSSQDKENLMTSGRFSWSDKDEFPVVDARIKASGIRAERYSSYYDTYLPYLIEKAGVDLSAVLSLGQKSPAPGSGQLAEDKNSSLNLSILADSLTIDDLCVRQKVGPGNPMLEIPKLHLGETKMLLGDKKLFLGPVETQKGKVFLYRQADGTTNFSLPPSFLKSQSRQEDAGRKDPIPGKWQVSLESLALDDYELQFTDTATLDPVALTLDQVHMSTGEVNFTDTGKSDAELDLKWNQKGSISVKGDFGLHPLNAHLYISLEDFALPPLSPYLEDQIRIRVTQGNAFAKGKVTIETDSSHSASVSCQGNLSVKDFTSIDKILSKKILTWKNLDVSGLDLDVFPVSLDIEEIALDDFFSQAAISEQGRSNFGELVVQTETKGSSPVLKNSEKGKPAQLEIGKIRLQKGQISFSDYFVSPHFQVDVTDLEGTIKGISSRKDALATMDIKAIHEQSSPITFTGTLNPFAQNFSMDIKGTLADVEMARLTPYSAKYLGRNIDKGKLAMDLEYVIKGSKLNSRNLLCMDQFVLGKSVQSKDAVSLPLDLAISLLRNKKGMIDINVPVSGDLSDPDFSMGSVIFRVIQNIIIKTVSAPFSILGALVGSGEELGYVVFSPGSQTISDPEKKKLEILGKALTEKPALRLEIKGTWDPELDIPALKEIWFENYLKSMKLKARRNSGEVSLSQVTLSSQERSRYIEKAWKEKTFEVPFREDSSDETEKDEAEKQALLVEHAPVTDSELRNLAMERGTKIKEYLLSLDLIGEERLFLLEPGMSDKKEEKQVRVDFSIR